MYVTSLFMANSTVKILSESINEEMFYQSYLTAPFWLLEIKILKLYIALFYEQILLTYTLFTGDLITKIFVNCSFTGLKMSSKMKMNKGWSIVKSLSEINI